MLVQYSIWNTCKRFNVTKRSLIWNTYSNFWQWSESLVRLLISKIGYYWNVWRLQTMDFHVKNWQYTFMISRCGEKLGEFSEIFSSVIVKKKDLELGMLVSKANEKSMKKKWKKTWLLKRWNVYYNRRYFPSSTCKAGQDWKLMWKSEMNLKELSQATYPHSLWPLSMSCHAMGSSVQKRTTKGGLYEKYLVKIV